MVLFYGGESALGAEIDPALLAFVKCHVTSALKWDVMRVLSEVPGGCIGVRAIASRVGRPVEAVCAALESLAEEGLVESASGPEGTEAFYRLDPMEPSSVVLRRLIDTSTRSQELRGIIAAHLVRTQATARRAA